MNVEKEALSDLFCLGEEIEAAKKEKLLREDLIPNILPKLRLARRGILL